MIETENRAGVRLADPDEPKSPLEVATAALIADGGPTDPAPEATPANEAGTTEADTTEAEGPDEATQALMAMLGLDHIPTVEEAKALLDARRDEVRRNVLMEADKRDWCYDGTRKVCANLRLKRPDDRQNFRFPVTVTMEIEVTSSGFTQESALARLERTGGILTTSWLNNHLYGMEVRSATVTPIEADGQTIQLGDNKPAQQGQNSEVF